AGPELSGADCGTTRSVLLAERYVCVSAVHGVPGREHFLAHAEQWHVESVAEALQARPWRCGTHVREPERCHHWWGLQSDADGGSVTRPELPDCACRKP